MGPETVSDGERGWRGPGPDGERPACPAGVGVSESGGTVPSSPPPTDRGSES